jgi:hypothetical protein
MEKTKLSLAAVTVNLVFRRHKNPNDEITNVAENKSKWLVLLMEKRNDKVWPRNGEEWKGNAKRFQRMNVIGKKYHPEYVMVMSEWSLFGDHLFHIKAWWRLTKVCLIDIHFIMLFKDNRILQLLLRYSLTF